MLSTLAIANYRSLRQLSVPLGRLTIVTGPNGSGKSSIYRALRLLAEIAQGGVIRSLVREGGLTSTLWAGPEHFSGAMLRGEAPVQGAGKRREPVNLRLGFAGEAADDFGYAIDIGLPRPSADSAFSRDPQIKREAIWCGPILRPATQLVDRKGHALRLRDAAGAWNAIDRPVPSFASMLTEYADPRGAPEMLTLRERMRAWRFYDHFRSDAEAPARSPQLGTYTPVMANDGADVAAALQTIREIGDAQALDRAVDDAFPGARIDVAVGDDHRFELRMHQHGLLRPLTAAELSDGTLRYLHVDRRAADAAAARTAGAQRARDQPPPRPAARARSTDRAGGAGLAGDRGVARGASDRGHRVRVRRGAAGLRDAGEAARRDPSGRDRRPRCPALALAGALNLMAGHRALPRIPTCLSHRSTSAASPPSA